MPFASVYVCICQAPVRNVTVPNCCSCGKQTLLFCQTMYIRILTMLIYGGTSMERRVKQKRSAQYKDSYIRATIRFIKWHRVAR